MAQIRKNNFGDMNSGNPAAAPVQPQYGVDAMPMDVGHKMVKSGKATHPHWRSGAKGNKHAKRMYDNATTAHGHTAVKP